MSSGRVYTASGALVTYTATALTPIFYGLCAATNPADILAIRIGLYSGASVSYPSLGTVLPQLSRVTGTAAGGTTATASPHNPADVAANTTFKDASGAAITGLTQGAELWSEPLPFSAGANWAEWVTPGAEWRIPPSGAFAIYLTASAAGVGTQFKCSVVLAE